MAIFGNFDRKAPVEVIKDILLGIEKEADGELNAKRYRQQLRGLVQLRKLTKQFKKAMAIVGTFKVEKDPFYQQGRREARNEERARAKAEKKEMAMVLKNKNVALDIIIEATGLSIEEIKAL
jgi:predicted transposase YdaD